MFSMTAVCFALIVTTGFAQEFQPLKNQVFRSTATGWVIPGGAVDAPAVGLKKEAVQQWEGLNADITFGGPAGSYFNITCEEGVTPSSAMTPDCEPGVRIQQTGYMYNQMLELTPYSREVLVKHLAGGDTEFEKLMLHYAVDTPYNLTGLATDHGDLTLINGVPWVVAYTAAADHAGFNMYQQPPWNREAFKTVTNGGALYVVMDERFSGLNFTIVEQSATTFDTTIEYISACDEVVNQQVPQTGAPNFRRVSQWSNATITADGTNGMTKSGIVRFNVPQNWKRCTTSDGSGRTYGGAPYLGSVYLRDGVGAFIVKIKLFPRQGVTQADQVVYPTLNALRIPLFIRYTNPANPNVHFRTIPGWNPANDRNGDGWVDDAEFASLVDPSATARFEYESRAIPLGRMWSARSSWCRVNAFLSNHSGTILGEYLKREWQAGGFLGAYNDDLLKLVGPDEFYIDRRGVGANSRVGFTNEYPSHPIDSEEIVVPYRHAFASMLETIKQTTQSTWIMGNIANVNLLQNNDTMMFYNVITCFLREDYITPWLGITGAAGVARLWDTFIFAAAGKKSMIQVLLRDARAHHDKTSRVLWEGDVYSGTALYYFVNIPGMTFYNAWGNGFNYGSDNTYGGINWWKDGIPMNMAYQPVGLLNCHIGVPDTAYIPEDPLHYQITIPKVTDYSVMGNSSSTVITHQMLNGGLPVNITPSHIYHAWRGPRWVTGQPQDTVFARKYTTGLVLYRTDTFGRNKASVDNADPVLVTVQLNGTFRKVAYDGTLGPEITEVSLGMFEAAILETADARGPTKGITGSAAVTVSNTMVSVTIFLLFLAL